MPFDLCHWASVLSNQQRLILPKSPPEHFFLFVKSKGYFSDINWSSWSIWPCQPLFKFPCRQPSMTSGSLGFHMTFLLVLLRLFFSPGFVPQTSLSLYTACVILYSFPLSVGPVLWWLPDPRLIPDLTLCFLFENPLAFWTFLLQFFRGFSNLMCPEFIWSFPTPSRCTFTPVFSVPVNSTNHPAAWAGNVGVVLDSHSSWILHKILLTLYL